MLLVEVEIAKTIPDMRLSYYPEIPHLSTYYVHKEFVCECLLNYYMYYRKHKKCELKKGNRCIVTWPYYV